MDNEDHADEEEEDDDGIGEDDDGDVGLGVGQVAERRAPFQSGWAVCAAMVVVGFGRQVVVCCPWRRPHRLSCEAQQSVPVTKSRTAVKPITKLDLHCPRAASGCTGQLQNQPRGQVANICVI